MYSSKILYRIAYLLICIPIFIISLTTNLAESAGTTAFDFLKIGVGGRAIGMGETFIGIADDATAGYWNPAGLYQIDKMQLSMMHLTWLQGISYEFIGYGHALDKFGVIGISTSLLSAGKMPKTVDEGGQYSEVGTFTATNIAGLISYARSIKEVLNLKDANLGIGINIKFLHQQIDMSSAWGFATDIGILYEFPASTLEKLMEFMTQKLKHEIRLNKIAVGVAIQNLGPKVRSGGKGYSLPFKIGVGGAIKLLDDNLTIATDINIPNDNNPYICLGTEYWVTNIIAARIGYKTGSNSGGLSGLRIGTGINLKTFQKFKLLELDYAFSPYGDLGLTHRVSMVMEF